MVKKIDKSIEEFKFNVSISNFYEDYNIFNRYVEKNINNSCLTDNITKIMKLMIPFTPHLAYECLTILGCKSMDVWPEIKVNLTEEVKFAVQINGKTRDIISVKKNLEEKTINKMVLDVSKAKIY